MSFQRLLSLFFLLLAFNGAAQNYALELQIPPSSHLQKQLKVQDHFINIAAREKELQRILFVCYDNAYLTAHYDTIAGDSLNMKLWLRPGELYKWAKLGNGNVDEGVLSEIGFREKLYSQKPIYYKNVGRLQERLIRYYENNGYPFASVQLTNIEIDSNSISAELFLQKKRKILQIQTRHKCLQLLKASTWAVQLLSRPH